jgi:hypothetical protein
VTFDINKEIAERIMGWEVFTMAEGPGGRFYRDAMQGAIDKLPDFVLLQKDYELLRQTMVKRGYDLTVTENAPDIKNNVGRTFTATYRRQSESFQGTQGDEKIAVCVAALKAYGLQLPSDE